MRLVIKNDENNKMTVGVDGVFYAHLDATGLASDIHAVQWYNDHGEIERKDPMTGKMVVNEEISSVEDFQFAVDAWNVAYQAKQDALAAELESASNKSGELESASNESGGELESASNESGGEQAPQ